MFLCIINAVSVGFHSGILIPIEVVVTCSCSYFGKPNNFQVAAILMARRISMSRIDLPFDIQSVTLNSGSFLLVPTIVSRVEGQLVFLHEKLVK
jgi:hypothetical protein